MPTIYYSLDLIDTLVIGCSVIQLGYALTLILALKKAKESKWKQTDSPTNLPPLSVIIAARNEAENLRQNLPQILNQRYPDFEVIVVNDRSDDDTMDVLEKLRLEYHHLSVINAEKEVANPGKKNAIDTGIQNARHDLFVFTDADCRPLDDKWVEKFGIAYHHGNDLVLGFGLFEKSNSFVNRYFRLESLRIAFMYLTAAVHFKPYMGVGRSMGYSRNLYNAVDGFLSHRDIPSGDDDLFVQDAQSIAKTVVIPNALTISQSPDSWSQLIEQKKRHTSTGKRYRKMTLLVLWLTSFTDMFSIMGLFGLILTESWFAALIVGVLIGFRYVIYMRAVHRLNNLIAYQSASSKDLCFDPFVSILNPLFSVASQVWPSKEWKRKS